MLSFPGARFLANLRVENTAVSKNNNLKALFVVITKHAEMTIWEDFSLIS